MQSSTFRIITGAASGIGRDLAQTLQARADNLILIDRDEKKLQAEFQESDKLKIFAGDVSLPALWEEVIGYLADTRSLVSHLINCAGVIRPGFVQEFDLGDIDYHLDTNTKGSILGITLIGRVMKKQGKGHILTVCSLAGLAPVSGLSLYSASKFAIRGFSLAVAPELEAHGVYVSVICPDLVDTPMLALQLDYPEEAVLTFSGPKKVLHPADITKQILKLMERPRRLVCVPEHRGLLAKLAGSWPRLAELFRKKLERKGKEAIKSYQKN